MRDPFSFKYYPRDDFEKVSEQTKKALQVLKKNGVMTSRQFAKIMYPESESWKTDKGKSIVYAAGNTLARLFLRGLASRRRVMNRVVEWKISPHGIEALLEVET